MPCHVFFTPGRPPGMHSCCINRPSGRAWVVIVQCGHLKHPADSSLCCSGTAQGYRHLGDCMVPASMRLNGCLGLCTSRTRACQWLLLTVDKVLARAAEYIYISIPPVLALTIHRFTSAQAKCLAGRHALPVPLRSADVRGLRVLCVHHASRERTPRCLGASSGY